jgi:hypothetical protein
MAQSTVLIFYSLLAYVMAMTLYGSLELARKLDFRCGSGPRTRILAVLSRVVLAVLAGAAAVVLPVTVMSHVDELDSVPGFIVFLSILGVSTLLIARNYDASGGRNKNAA